MTGETQPTPRVRYAPIGVSGLVAEGRRIIDEKYEVLRLLGEGGMGAVYEARHRTTGRTLAVKVIAPTALARGEGILARFQREARASGSIDSPYVVQTLDAGVDRDTGAPYMAMECLVGEDVQTLVARTGPLRPEVVLCIGAHACHGLQKAHEAGIVHRDIKSANLFLAKRGGDSDKVITKVLDFGIAKVRASPLVPLEDNKLTTTGSMLGSPVYMSPEQAIGAKDLDARSDIFSLGVTMYEALTGATPYGHLDCLGALVMAICSHPVPSLLLRAPWVSAEVAAVVHKALAIHPADRFPSAAAFREAIVALLARGDTTLRADMLRPLTRSEMGAGPAHSLAPDPASVYVATVPSPTAPPPALTPGASPRARPWALIAIAAASLVGMALMGSWFAFGRHLTPVAAPPVALASPSSATRALVSTSVPAREPARDDNPSLRAAAAAEASSTTPTAMPTAPRARPLPGAAVSATKAATETQPLAQPQEPTSPPSAAAPIAKTTKAPVPIDRDDPWAAAR